jgi:hypothetical protein
MLLKRPEKMPFKKHWLYYIVGTVVFIVLFGVNKGWCLFLLIGFGLGILFHGWLKDMYDNTVNAFYTGEVHKRDMKRKELEQELERLNQGD